MVNSLLVSTAYGWFIGLLVLMVVMAVMFILIAVFALKPFKVGDGAEDSDLALKMLDEREAELTSKLLNNYNDAVVLQQLKEVAMAKKIVSDLVSGVEDTQTAAFVPDLSGADDGGQVSIEQTFNVEPSDDDGLKKSFSAKLIQSADEIKVWYFEIKNCILCYEKTKAHMQWNNEKFFIGKYNVATLTMRGKQLCLYLAVNADEYSGRFPVKASTSDMYKEATPCLFRIKSEKHLKQAKELIGLMMSDYGVMYLRTNHSIYAMPYEDDDALVAKGLAKRTEAE